MSNTNNDLFYLPAWRIMELYASGDLKPSEYVEMLLNRIAKIDPVLKSFITVAGDEAIQAAKAEDKRIAEGGAAKPLSGIPIGVKDCIWTKGMLSTNGSAAWRDYYPTEDATGVRKTRENGGIIIGKNNIPEICSFPLNENPLFGRTGNPYDLSRVPGASSGGSAAAVAAGLVPLSIGGDGGGSTRIPSALCGVVGVMPTRGTVSLHGVMVGTPTSSIGPIARNVRDAAILLDAMSGFDRFDNTGRSTCLRGPVTKTLEDGVEGCKILFTPDLGHIENKDSRSVDLAYAAAKGLEAVGATVYDEPIYLPYTFDLLVKIIIGLQTYSASPKMYLKQPEAIDRLKNIDPMRLSPHARPQEGAFKLSLEDFEEGWKVRDQIQCTLDEAFDKYDVIMTLTVAEIAPKFPDEWVCPYKNKDNGTLYTGMVNITESCAATVPCGYVDGMPVGVQVIGRSYADAKVMRVCRAIEKTLEGKFDGTQKQMLENLNKLAESSHA